MHAVPKSNFPVVMPHYELQPLSKESARAFRLELQAARENAIKDAEAFDGIIHVIERLGILKLGRIGDLGKYGLGLAKLAAISPLSSGMPREWHTPFDLLYDMVMKARNDALHIGAFARHLTTHAIELALVLEDALRTIENSMNKQVSDFMIRNPVCAQLWQPVSFIRQVMLTNSFSYLPVLNKEKEWRLVSDLQIARYLQGSRRNISLAQPLADTGIVLLEARLIGQDLTIDKALERSNGMPLLVCRDGKLEEIVGILTPFDLL